MPSIKQPHSGDVARVAEVSRAPVPAVANGNRFVSSDLRLRLEQAVAQLGYRPDTIARSLKNRRTGTIGLVIPSIVSHFWAPGVRGAEAVLAGGGFRLVPAKTGEEGARAEASLEGLLEYRVDGVTFAPPAGSQRKHYDAYPASGRPLVCIERTVPEVVADYVGVDG